MVSTSPDSCRVLTHCVMNDKLECPECRKNHEAEGIKSFPQNKYLLSQVKRKSPEDVTIHKAKLCEEHQYELILFCLEASCQRAICISCLNEKHRRHDVTGIECGQREVLTRNLSIIERNLKNKLAVFSAAKNDVRNKGENCKLDLKKRKEEIDKHFDEMAKEVDQKVMESVYLIDNQIEAVNENIKCLQSLKNTAENNDTDTKDSTINTFETVVEIKENVRSNLSGVRIFSFLKYEPNESLSALVGSLRETPGGGGVCPGGVCPYGVPAQRGCVCTGGGVSAQGVSA